MAESEDTTSLTGVTRRELLNGAATIPLALNLRGQPTDTAADPIAALYRDWQQADAEVRHWCREWGQLESAIAHSVGFPRVEISLPSSSMAPTWVTTHEDIDRTLADRPDLETLRRSLHAELAARTARWDAEATAIGLAEADQQQALAFERREALASRAFALSAGDLAGVLTKLMLVLRMGAIQDGDDAFPWPQIQSVIHDLRCLMLTYR